MKTSVVLRATQACVFAGMLGLMNLSVNAASGGGGPGGGGPGGPSDPCTGNAYREICDTFETSLHKTRMGKPRHYNAEYGGFELLTGVPYDDLVCKDCHNPANQTTPVPYEPSCYDCHIDTDEDNDANPFNDPVTGATCRGCHSRRNAENAFSDVHRAVGMDCMDCHHKEEMHGDGNAYESMQEPGALKVSCTQAGCHKTEDLLPVVRPGKGKKSNPEEVNERALGFHQQHFETLDCSACHVQSVVACDSCHFDSEVVERKRYYRQIPQSGFKFLMNKDDKVKTATYQALTWGNNVSFYVLAPFSAHTISKGTEVECLHCHVQLVPAKAKGGGRVIEGNAALASYLTNGTITVNKWVPEEVDDGNPLTYGKLLAPQGIIPVVPDWKDALQFDFVYWTGLPTDPVVRDETAEKWNFLKSGADLVHMPYGSALTEEQLDRLVNTRLKKRGGAAGGD
jgi:hypothetical protein